MKLERLLPSLVLAVSLGACGQDDPRPGGVQAGEPEGLSGQAREALDKGRALLSEFQRASREKLAEAGSSIEELKRKAQAAAAEHKPELDALVERLASKKQALLARLGELEDASAEKLEALKRELEPKIAELERAARDALERLK